MVAEAHESALVVLVPEAEAVAGPCRALYDPSAAWGIPAHITVLYPFKPPEGMTDADLDALRRLFARFPRFEFALTEVRRFPNALYLAPEPAGPFQALTKAVGLLYPEYPPYEGEFDEVIPHLTLASTKDGAQLDQIADEFARSCLGKLPVQAQAQAVVLMDDRAGAWQVREVFPLAQVTGGRTPMELYEVQHDGFTLSTDRTKLDIPAIHEYLSQRSYWAEGRPLAVVEQSIASSLCFGVFHGERQAGFARVVTDFATFAWLCDVFILEDYRGRGLGKWLIETITNHPALASLRLFVLATRDAHALYQRYGGFEPLPYPENWMRRRCDP